MIDRARVRMFIRTRLIERDVELENRRRRTRDHGRERGASRRARDVAADARDAPSRVRVARTMRCVASTFARHARVDVDRERCRMRNVARRSSEVAGDARESEAPSASRAIVDVAGGARAIVDVAERYASLRTLQSLVVAVVLVRHVASARVQADVERRVEAVEREYARAVALDDFNRAIALKALKTKRRDRKKTRVRPKDRACNQPKPRQGRTRAEAREEKARTCVACERLGGQKEFFRIVRAKLRPNESDEDGMTVKENERFAVRAHGVGASGRSAYVCRSRACVERAIRTNAIGRCLKIKTSKDVLESLRKEAIAHEEANGTDTRGMVYLRPEGASSRWVAPGEWVNKTDERARGVKW